MWWRLGEVGVMLGEVVGRTTPATRIGNPPWSLKALLTVTEKKLGTNQKKEIDIPTAISRGKFSDPIRLLPSARYSATDAQGDVQSKQVPI